MGCPINDFAGLTMTDRYPLKMNKVLNLIYNCLIEFTVEWN